MYNIFLKGAWVSNTICGKLTMLPRLQTYLDVLEIQSIIEFLTHKRVYILTPKVMPGRHNILL